MIPNYDRDIKRKKLKTSMIIDCLVLGTCKLDVCGFLTIYSINEIQNQKFAKEKKTNCDQFDYDIWLSRRDFLIINLVYCYA